MKKLTALLLAVLLVFTLASCGGRKDADNKLIVYTFNGGNGYFRVTNGVIAISKDEEVFSGGNLNVADNPVFADVSFLRTEFYILRDGEEKTVLVSERHNQSGGASISISDDLGAISGEAVVSEGRQPEEVEIDLQNNLFFKLTVNRNDGTSNTYAVQMDVEGV